MLLIVLIRIAITLTFFLLIVEGVAAIIVIRRFYSYYEYKHQLLEARVKAVEQRLGMDSE